jgi:hypothetical protein
MRLSFDTAKQIAEREAQQRIAASPIFSRYQFTPLSMQDETDQFWVFVSSSEGLFEDGVTPDAIYMCVDKADGHIWSRLEQEAFYTQPATANNKSLPTSRVA